MGHDDNNRLGDLFESSAHLSNLWRSDISDFSGGIERINSRITSVAALPVILQYSSSFSTSLEVRFIVSRLMAHFLLFIIRSYNQVQKTCVLDSSASNELTGKNRC